jgi:glycine/D-amino acid oxidase-like deaminating enzyme
MLDRVAGDWGMPPWRVDVGDAGAPLPAHVDVAVVGAGLAGLATACELRRRGAGVAVLEAERVGAGASGHTGGIALEGTAVGLLPDAEDCLGALERAARRAGVPDAIDLRGCLEIAHEPQPDGRAPFWSDGEGALWVADRVPGGTIEAGTLLAGLARAAVGAGAVLHAACRVVGVEAGGELRLVTTLGTIVADRVAIAVNAYTPTVVALPVDLRPALTLAVATAPIDAATLDAIGPADGLPFYTQDLPYLWGRRLGDRLMFGSGLVFPPAADVRLTDVHDAAAESQFATLEKRIATFHPLLARVPIERRWGGPISFIPTRAPILSTLPGEPRVVVTGGCAGHGVALSIRLGELIAEHVATGRALPEWGRLPGA